ncbi:RDD family protein [Cellulomonas sp. PhB150]|uniref:RDD family protein n=1 Tax=Cellulomonas sp. PhB150 TaxID=2485188 RepID=UPI000F4A71AE|nr:RDD family protein [Cellulomonas sp. PhB150]ROS31028.1 pSer/pThr/pTyr-binding forkhead associated (FHA) protein [Cellulomonas sp. PhB150]
MTALAQAPATVASLGRRLAGFLLDGVVAGLAAVPLLVGTAADGGTVLVVLGSLLVVAVVVLQWVWHGRLGWTLGRLVLGMRTADVETLQPIGMARVLLRGLVVAAGALAFGVGQLVVLASPAFDRTGRNRGWHDRAARDEVVDIRRDAPAAPAWRDDATDVRVPPRAAAVRAARSVEAPVPPWLSPLDGTEAPTVTGSQPLLLAPLAPREHGPDVDTRTIPVVRTTMLGERPVAQHVGAPPPAPPAAPVRAPALALAEPLAEPPAEVQPTVVEPLVVTPVGLDPEVEMTRRSVPRPEPVAVPEPATTAELALSDGRRVVVEGVALVGRNPAAAIDVQIVRVIDPGRSVSKTHLQVAVTPTGVWVADRGSTNGTVVTLPDGAQVVCPVDQPIRLRPGATVAFGDYSFVVVRGPAARS